MKDRWNHIGRMWPNPKGGFSGFIDFGLFGEIRVLVKPDKTREGEFRIISLASRLPLNQLDMLGKDLERDIDEEGAE